MNREQALESLAIHCRSVPAEAVAAEAQNHPSDDRETAWAAATEALAVKALLLAEAERLNVRVRPIEDDTGRALTADDARIEALLEQEVVAPKADEASCRRYYESHLDRFRSPDLVEASHILFAASASDEIKYSQAISEARSTLAELGEAPEHFARLAAERSACPSARQDGNLGQIGPGQTVDEFETALFGLEPGQVHPEPVTTRYGAHIVKAGRKVPGRTLPFELVHEKIAAYLEEASWRAAVAQYIGTLAIRSQRSPD